MAFLRGCLLVALALCVACSANEPAQDPVVVILRNGLPACSGFAIQQNQILTSAHCVEDSESVEFVTARMWAHTARASLTGRVVFADTDRDLAVLQSPETFPAPVQLRVPVIGERVHSRSVMFDAEHPHGEVLKGVGFFRDTTLNIRPGWSGSPVFGADGKVVGIVRSCMGGTYPYRFCLPNNAVFSVLP